MRMCLRNKAYQQLLEELELSLSVLSYEKKMPRKSCQYLPIRLLENRVLLREKMLSRNKIALKLSKFSYSLDGNGGLPIIKKANQLIISNPVRGSARLMEGEDLIPFPIAVVTKGTPLR